LPLLSGQEAADAWVHRHRLLCSTGHQQLSDIKPIHLTSDKSNTSIKNNNERSLFVEMDQ
jgi:hypothetical protein